MHGYIIKSKSLKLSTSGRSPGTPFAFSANAVAKSGLPVGLVISEGKIHHSMPERLPALLSYHNGDVEIRSTFNARDVAEASFVISGTSMLVENGERVKIDSPLNIRHTVVLKRMGLGMLRTGELLVLVVTGTVRDLQIALIAHKAMDGMMTAYDDVYLDYPDGGISMGNTLPITTLEAREFESLPRPIVVIDAGHGGVDPGASGFDLLEKDLNLRGANIMYQYFLEHYQGTFLMTRIYDETVPLKDRPMWADAVGADFFISLHSNAHTGQATGFESFVHDKNASPMDYEVQRVVHRAAMDFLTPYGFRDRGRKKANFCVLRETECTSLLVENLFIDNPKDNEFLRDSNMLRGLYLAEAEGFAKAIGLLKNVAKKAPEEHQELYRVQTGAFTFKKNAEQLAEKLKADGYETYLVKY